MEFDQIDNKLLRIIWRMIDAIYHRIYQFTIIAFCLIRPTSVRGDCKLGASANYCAFDCKLLMLEAVHD